MFKGVTVWTKDNKISQLIIPPCAIFMMDAQNFRVDRITTLHTFGNHIAALKCFPNRLETTSFSFLHCFIFAQPRTILSFMGRRCSKFLLAKQAILYDAPFKMLCFIVTLARTIFRFTFSASDIVKNFITYLAIGCKLFLGRLPPAFRRAKHGCELTIWSYPKWLSASPALKNYLHTYIITQKTSGRNSLFKGGIYAIT